MKSRYLFITLLLSTLSFGQGKSKYLLVDQQISKMPVRSSNSTENIAHYINSNFETADDKIRAVFYWTASNISYDLKNMFADDFNGTPQERITKTLQSRKGVCIDYANVFNAIANKVGIKAVIVEGYTKQNGKVNSLAHAWCAAKIDGSWYLFDPTWASGGIINGRFVSKINDSYFKVNPLKSVSSHMPFDYLWQFLNYPITNKDFYEGKIQINRSRKYFDFAGEIEKLDRLTDIERVSSSAYRIEENGAESNLIVERLTNKKEELKYLEQRADIQKLNGIVSDYNFAVNLFNDFIYYRNRQFKPSLPDVEIARMIEIPRGKLLACQNAISAIGEVGAKNPANLKSLKKSIHDILIQVEEQNLFVRKYLSKDKVGRKEMFFKTTLFNVPL